jgi:hypothetical protein
MAQRYVNSRSTALHHEANQAQIFPTAYRARGLNFAASGGAIGSIVVAQVWPVGIDKIGSKVYFYFMAVNLVCIPVCSPEYTYTARVAY